MKKSIYWLIIFFIILTSYTPKSSFVPNLNLNIKKIIIENNSVLESSEIKEKISFVYKENLLFLDLNEIEKNLKDIDFIESFSIKKIYPNKLKLIIVETKPIAILQQKKKKFYISNKGKIVNFRKLEVFKNLPTVFGSGKMFISFYKNLLNIKFPVKMIKSYYFFESGRWNLIMNDNKEIKLPTQNYLLSLKNFMLTKNDINFDSYQIFDYRIKNQVILK